MSVTGSSLGNIRVASPQRIVIAGGPGSGKSTLLQALAASGENCHDEVSRVLIREQLALGGDRLPWGNLWAFAEECSERMHVQLMRCVCRGRCFFDRGLPDLAGYLNRGGHSAPNDWRATSRAYAREVFFAPPWREIYVNDAERPQTFAEAQTLSEYIRNAYLDYGFRVIELIEGSVADRMQQILHHLGANARESQYG
jgi:predicted ATPase